MYITLKTSFGLSFFPATCGLATTIPHAYSVLNDAGTEATYTCNDGYQLADANQNKLTCTAQDTVWSGTPPRCDPIGTYIKVL